MIFGMRFSHLRAQRVSCLVLGLCGFLGTVFFPPVPEVPAGPKSRTEAIWGVRWAAWSGTRAVPAARAARALRRRPFLVSAAGSAGS